MSQAAALQTMQHTAALQPALVTILAMLQLALLCNVLHTFYNPLWQSSQKLCNFHICVILHRRTENQRQQKVFNTAFHVQIHRPALWLHAFYGGFDIFYMDMCERQAWVWRQKCLFWLNNSDNSFNDTRRCWEKQWVAENGRNPWCCAIGGWWQIPKQTTNNDGGIYFHYIIYFQNHDACPGYKHDRVPLPGAPPATHQPHGRDGGNNRITSSPSNIDTSMTTFRSLSTNEWYRWFKLTLYFCLQMIMKTLGAQSSGQYWLFKDQRHWPDDHEQSAWLCYLQHCTLRHGNWQTPARVQSARWSLSVTGSI